jgi:hypothetical protein
MSSEGRICPQCGYTRQLKDIVPDYECPRCGIIYDKYVAPKQIAPPPSGISPSVSSGIIREIASNESLTTSFSKKGEENLKPASMRMRALALIYTNARISLYVIPIQLLFLIGFRIFNPPDSIPLGLFYIEIPSQNWQIANAITSLLIILWAFVYRSLTNDSTCGQDKFGIVVRSAYNEKEVPTLQAKLLRQVGQVIALCTYPVTLLGFLYGLFTKQHIPGIADRISSTRQYETCESPIHFRLFLSKSLSPVLSACLLEALVVVLISVWIMNGYHEEIKCRNTPSACVKAKTQTVPLSPEEKAKLIQQRKEADKMQDRMIEHMEANEGPTTLRIISSLERRYLQEEGDFTEDLQALINRYDPNHRQNLHALFGPIMEGTLKAQKTAQGIVIRVQTATGDWLQEEIRK